jgi:hypothetical protein
VANLEGKIEFVEDKYVEQIVNSPGDKGQKPRPTRSAECESEFHFSFGARRYASSGARRLFVAQTSAVPPIVGPELARPQTLLRHQPEA